MNLNSCLSWGRNASRILSCSAAAAVVQLLTAACLICLTSCTHDLDHGKDSGPDDSPPILQDIRISGAELNSKIEIIVSKPLRYKLYNIGEPPREVVDLYPAVLSPFKSPLDVKSSLVSRIDIAQQDNNGRPFTRVIFKLNRIVDFSSSTDPLNNKDIILSVLKPKKSAQSVIGSEKDRTAAKINSRRAIPQGNVSAGSAASASYHGARNSRRSGRGETEKILHGIKFIRNGIEITLNGTRDNFRFFKLAGPQRLVIDVFGAKNAMERNIIPVKRFGVEKIRLGTYPDKVRIVFDSSKNLFPAFRIKTDAQGIQVLFKE